MERNECISKVSSRVTHCQCHTVSIHTLTFYAASTVSQMVYDILAIMFQSKFSGGDHRSVDTNVELHTRSGCGFTSW